MQNVAKRFALIAALVASGCGDDDSPDELVVDGSAVQVPETDAAVASEDAQVAAADAAPPTSADKGKTGCEAIEIAPPKSGMQLEMPLPVPPATEREYCMLHVIQKDINLNWTDGRFTKGSHHGNLYRTSYKGKVPTVTITGETLENADRPHPCSTPTAVWDVRGVIATGRPVDRAKLDAEGNPEPGVKVLPGNVAVKLRKGDVVLLNFHMINTTEKPLESCLKFNMHGISADKAEIEAGVLFAYNTMITVPAMGESTARMACPVTKDVTLATANSHMHARGDGYIAKLLDKAPTDPSAQVVTELYKGTEWDDPKARVFEQPLQLKAGQWIDYECHFTNKEPRSVSQGFASTDEMCMFTGNYWPQDIAFENCQNGTSKSTGATSGIVYGNGTKSGAEFLQCFWAQEERVFSGAFDDQKRYDTLACFTQTCPKASPGMNPYLTCLADHTDGCTADCSAAEASFQAACSFGECKEEYGSNGSDGTCAKSVGPQAVAACTKPAQISSFTNSCITGSCAAACADPSAPACAICIGSFDPSSSNTSCMQAMVGACAQDQGKKIATQCVTDCFTTCITKEITSCSVNCLNNVACKPQFQTLAVATCN